ncbi:GNAT family N-acetyltransferase [Pilimelia terevasa]|nr:GNAT family N-acetyltransferase [Pilimelia terevasa]
MELSTARLRLREWADRDAARCLDLYRRDEVVRWIGGAARAVTDLDQARARIAEYQQRNAAAADPCGIWAAADPETDVVRGCVLLKVLPRTDGAVGPDIEVGWHLHPDSWGRGYATELGRWALDRAFAAGLPEVYAVVFPDNAASVAVARRLGMRAEGTTDRWYGETLAVFRLGRAAAG